MAEPIPSEKGKKQIKFISKKSPDYKLEFVNGAFSNITPRGEIVIDFHFESKDMPIEQVADIINEGTGQAKLLDPVEPETFTRDTKFGIIINPPFAKDLLVLLSGKIDECEKISALREAAEKAKEGDHQ